MKKSENQLIIGWLYPELMSTYGDRGNVICLEKRCSWRGIKTEIKRIDATSSHEDISSCNMILGGGAQDRQQEIVIGDLKKKKTVLKTLFDKGIPGLFVCGSPQLLGRYYMTGNGVKLEGLGIFDYYTRHFGHDKPRCIGNTAGEIIGIRKEELGIKTTIVGFENHGGRTYLGKTCKPFARVLRGFGNNGEDGYEGAVYKNVIACYYHGPFLPKNPHIADWLTEKALEVKYKKPVNLSPLDDTLEWKAHDVMLKRLGVETQ